MQDQNIAPSTQPVVMYQRWEELLFLHWSFDRDVIQETLPPRLTVDTYNGRAWVGVVPFFMSGVRPRFLPAVLGVSSFQELNLRTYVVDEQGRSGVWFYSLDTSHRLPVWIARRFFHLNYCYAQMRSARQGSKVCYESRRRLIDEWDVAQEFEWSRTGLVRNAEKGSLEEFLVERYRLYAFDAKREVLLTGRVAHEPYPIQSAKLTAYSKQLFTLNKLYPPVGGPESVIATEGVDVRIYPLERI